MPPRKLTAEAGKKCPICLASEELAPICMVLPAPMSVVARAATGTDVPFRGAAELGLLFMRNVYVGEMKSGLERADDERG